MLEVNCEVVALQVHMSWYIFKSYKFMQKGPETYYILYLLDVDLKKR